MSLTYDQRSGVLSLDGHEWGAGYSGSGIGKNNASMEDMPNVGPIPKGKYAIGDWHDNITKGPVVCRLIQIGHDAHGRTAFMIHGDSREHPGEASQGCIVLPKAVRARIQATHQTEIEVV